MIAIMIVYISCTSMAIMVETRVSSASVALMVETRVSSASVAIMVETRVSSTSSVAYVSGTDVKSKSSKPLRKGRNRDPDHTKLERPRINVVQEKKRLTKRFLSSQKMFRLSPLNINQTKQTNKPNTVRMM